METELTKEMKRAIRNYSPAMKSNMRTIRWAEEVTTGTGIVDSIRFEDYVENDKSCCKKDLCKYDGENTDIDYKKCKGCVYKHNEYEIGMLITCYEMKITKSDFKSKNGHNFVGNHNYYVMPKELYPKVENLVEDGVGVILYYGNGCLIKKKECKFRKVEEEYKTYLLYNALKKWVDADSKTDYYKMLEHQYSLVYENYNKLYKAIWKEIDHDKLHEIYDKYNL